MKPDLKIGRPFITHPRNRVRLFNYINQLTKRYFDPGDARSQPSDPASVRRQPSVERETQQRGIPGFMNRLSLPQSDAM